MTKTPSRLTRSQLIGGACLMLLVIALWVGAHYLPSPPSDDSQQAVPDTLFQSSRPFYSRYRKRDRAYYDSLHLVRRDSLHRFFVAYRDSVRVTDSLWWDSVRRADSLHYVPYMKKAVKRDTVLDLNTADTLSLQLIRGIGPATARRIVRYREQLGGFVSAQQLSDDELYLDRYGRSTRSRYALPDSVLHSFVVTADSVRPIAVNRASVDRLQRHPYISYTLAKEIYDLRRRRVRLRQMSDLSDLPHMTDSLSLRLAPYLNFE